MQTFNLDIVSVQEHRRKTERDIDVVTQDKYKLFYSTANDRGQGGICILISQRLANTVTSVTKVTEQ